MVKPELIEEKPITIVELKQELTAIKKRDKELGFRSNKTEEYLSQFVELDTKKADELRKKLESFKEKKSPFVKQVKEKLGVPMNFEKVADKLTRTKKREKELLKGFEEIYEKGKGAYYSAGSRPNQTPESWGKARLASVLVGGKARAIDKKIVDKYKIPKI